MALTPASDRAGSWLDRNFPPGSSSSGGSSDVSRAQSVVDLAPSGQPPKIRPPKPPSSMTYEQFIMLPKEVRIKVWGQLPPWKQDEFRRRESGDRPA